MSRWMQVVAVALAAVVGLVPAFAQLGYAQAVAEAVPVIPAGEELTDEELLEVGGEQWVLRECAIGATLGIASGFTASKSGASLELSVGIGMLTFMGYLAGVWPRPPTSPSLVQSLLMDMLDPMRPLRNPRRYLY